MSSLRCLIVDDERLARESLRRLLAEIPGVEVVGEADRPARAIAEVNELRPDVLLLDVQMPGGGGFAVLRGLESPPPTVFVTAHDKFAVRAFEVNAVDYLLKPVEPARLRQALDRAAQRWAADGASVSVRPLDSTDAVWLEIGVSGHFRPLKDVLAIQADGKYSQVCCEDERDYLVRQSLAEWERRLPAEFFVRLDRGLIVNRAELRSVQFHARTASFAMGRVGRVFVVGRDASKKLRRILQPNGENG